MFEDAFPLTDPAPDPRSMIEALAIPAARPRPAGAYRDGLIVLLSASFDPEHFAPWPPMNTGRFVPFAYNALGDFFLWDREKSRVSRLEVQSGDLAKATDTIDEFLDVLLPSQEAIDRLLFREMIEQLVARWGPRKYGSVFIQVPWLMFGGKPGAENFEPGDVGVYVNLVGQTHFGQG